MLAKLKIKSGVYCIICTINNKKYVGSSKRISKRIHEHKYLLKNKNHHNRLITEDYEKHGIENFIFTKIEEVEDTTKLTERERYWIEFLETNNEDKGYNCSLPKTEDKKAEHSEETKNLQSKLKLEYIKNNKEKFYNNLNKIDRTKIKSSLAKTVIAINIETNEEKEFESIGQASRVLKLKYEKIQDCIRGNKMKQGKLVNVSKVGNYKFKIKN